MEETAAPSQPAEEQSVGLKPMSEARKKAIEAMIRGKQAYEERRKQLMASKQEPQVVAKAEEPRVEKVEKVESKKEEEYEFVRVPKMVWEDKLQRIHQLQEKAKRRKQKLEQLMTIKAAAPPQFLADDEDEEGETYQPPIKKVKTSPLNFNDNEFFSKRDAPTFSMPSSRILNMNALDNARTPQGVNKAFERTLRDKIKGR